VIESPGVTLRGPVAGPWSERRRRTVATALALSVLLTAAPGLAGTLASAILLSTDAQRLDCFLSNVGRTPVAITQVSIVNGGFTILSLSADTCTPALTPGGNCVFSALLDSRFSARGVVELRGSAKNLRGQCQLTSSSNHVVATYVRELDRRGVDRVAALAGLEQRDEHVVRRTVP